MRVSRQEAAPLQLNTAAPQKLRSAGTYDRGSYRKLTAVFYALFRAAAQRQKGVFYGIFQQRSMASFKINPYYLEIPVHIGYKYAVNDNFSLFANAGPYIAIGLFGKAKITADGSLVDGGSKVSESENVFGDDGFKRFDLGLGLKAGIEISKKYQFSIGYDFGFIEAEELMGCKNRNLMISLGLMF